MDWTEDRIELLKRRWGEGRSAQQIADELTGVTRNAVMGKIHRLGIQRRDAENSILAAGGERATVNSRPRPASRASGGSRAAAERRKRPAPAIVEVVAQEAPPADEAVVALAGGEVPDGKALAGVTAPVEAAPAALGGDPEVAGQPPRTTLSVVSVRDEAGDEGEPFDMKPAVAATMSLTPTTCRWPVGDPRTGEFRFCCASVPSGTPYCEEHAGVAYQPLKQLRGVRLRGQAA